MLQRDTPKQRELICKMIDKVDCPIYNDWTGEIMSKQEAKDYIREYRMRRQTV